MILLFIVFGVIIPTYLGVSAAILKWAVTITNAVLGGRKPTDLDYEFRGDSNIPVLKNKDGILIPELSSGYALAVVMIMNLLNLLVQVAFGMLAYHGKLLRVLGNTFMLAVNPFLPRDKRREITPEMLTRMRFGPAIFGGTLVVAILHWRQP